MAMGLKKRRTYTTNCYCSIFLNSSFYFDRALHLKMALNSSEVPSQVVSENINEDEVFRIGGLVKENSLLKDGNNVSFIVTDRANEVEVKFVGILPDLFSEGTGMIATGRLKSNIFEATEILAKHDENYMPKEVADALKEQGVFQE